MQHVIQKSDPRAYGDLLGRCELGRMGGIFGGDDAMLGGLCLLRVFRSREMI